jgi:Methylene-tetrahydrofolate reductase C terminal
MSLLQSAPRLLETTYLAARAALTPFRRWLRPGGTVERVFVLGERLTKGLVFDCRMCGQCVLHQTGMTCPMNCPKELRNGPCGGVRPDGRCEVKPEMTCVWLEAWERSKRMSHFGGEILGLQPPVDRRLQDTSAWINELHGRTGAPVGWSR